MCDSVGHLVTQQQDADAAISRASVWPNPRGPTSDELSRLRRSVTIVEIAADGRLRSHGEVQEEAKRQQESRETAGHDRHSGAQPIAFCTRWQPRPHRHRHRDRIGLLDRTACRTIRDIRARELERPPAVVAAASVELRGMIREGEPVPPKKLIEANTCGVELGLASSNLCLGDQHVGQPPPHLRIAARQHGPE
jgi:hypothetical protein